MIMNAITTIYFYYYDVNMQTGPNRASTSELVDKDAQPHSQQVKAEELNVPTTATVRSAQQTTAQMESC